MKRLCTISILSALTVVLGTAILSPPALATEARVAAMGGQGVLLQDDSNVSYFPATILRYKDLAVAELRFKDASEESYTIGVNLPVSEKAVLGVYLNEPVRLPVFPDNEEPGGYVPVSPDDLLEKAAFERTLTVYYGVPLSTFDVAAGLTVGMDKYKVDARQDVEESTRYLALVGGISNKVMDVGAKLEMPAVERSAQNIKDSWDGLGLSLGARMFMGKSDEMKIIPYGFFSTAPSTREAKQGTNKIETDLSATDIELGIGVSKKIGEKNLLVLGLEAIGMHTAKMEDTDPSMTATRKVLSLPGVFVGVESQIRPWMVGRVGAVERLLSVTTKWEMEGEDDLEVTERTSDLDITFGLGFRFARFQIDAVVNENLLFDGPNFISGTNEDMAHRLSVTCDLD